ncbi:HAD family hydrolase [Celerinatantimonas yamalensis]|uniref:phosphoglycolate phosphatase n=1 Tax=Celerinatantimonas yamalensis TaxID=559956 RepID=A0ABW9G891_9GAMM
MNICAVLFDMDGVMIDTHRCAYSVLSESAAEHGVQISADEIMTLGSLSGMQFWTFIKEKYSLKDSVEELVSGYDVQKEMSFYDLIGLMPNLVSVLKLLRNEGYFLGMVTSAKPIRANRILEMIGPDFAFDVVITADDVSDHKPSPKCYVEAVSRLGISPKEALVVEDSSNGAIAAQKAGCEVVGFKGSMWEHDSFKADYYIENHEELLESVLAPNK